MFVGLNPSTADETQDDPTIRRCMDFARRWGFGALCMTNLFAWRDTKPENMKKATDPIGPLNDFYLSRLARDAGIVIAAWGKHGSHLRRADYFKSLTSEAGFDLYALRLNGDGSPEHPLYIPATTKPTLLFGNVTESDSASRVSAEGESSPAILTNAGDKIETPDLEEKEAK